MALRVLIDTNVLLDYLLDREPYGQWARTIVEACQKRKLIGCIAAHSVTNIFYILRRDFSIAERKAILKDICRLFDVEGIDREKLECALANESFSDFEDCLQVECAKVFHADYIVTRNTKDFFDSTIACIEPEPMCEMIDKMGDA